MVVERLYYGQQPQETLAAQNFHFDQEVLERALRNIYRSEFRPMTDIERNLFHEFCKIFNRATEQGIRQAKHPDDQFVSALRHNNAVFAAFKTHRLQNDVARQLLDDNGVLKSFEQWKNDVRSITSHQCNRWLQTEYNTAVLRARQAANWQQFIEEEDVLPNLKWMPSTSPNPGADHRTFWNTVLPIRHPFWTQHRPGDRWNCKCDLRSTDETPTAVPAGSSDGDNPQPGLDNNPGIDAKIFAESHPYIANAYTGAREAVENAVKEMEEWDIDQTYGERLKINKKADKTELEDNIRAAKGLLESFSDMVIKIREHVLVHGVPNPEYEINGLVADRKGIKSPKGISSAFKKAIKQGCKSVVIDLDMNLKENMLQVESMARYIHWRNKDFKSGIIRECYVLYHGKAVKIDSSNMGREDIMEELEKLKQ
mgnify:CR=1 FL=1